MSRALEVISAAKMNAHTEDEKEMTLLGVYWVCWRGKGVREVLGGGGGRAARWAGGGCRQGCSRAAPEGPILGDLLLHDEVDNPRWSLARLPMAPPAPRGQHRSAAPTPAPSFFLPNPQGLQAPKRPRTGLSWARLGCGAMTGG